ncbi:MAG TPA: VOC family protein [Acidimicrobiales bacterium]|nr:VOC family protein [Acidimicrobiales bacterium]
MALPVSNVDNSIEFYKRWASMEVVGEPVVVMGTKSGVMTDQDRGFRLSLIQSANVQPISGNFHLGIAFSSKEELVRRAEEAQKAGLLSMGPIDQPPPLGYWAMLADPDGHAVELSFGQGPPLVDR